MSFNSDVLTVTNINSSTVQLSKLGDTNVCISSIVVYYDYTAVTGVTLSQTEASMIVGGETLTLTPTFTPSDASIKTVTWTTSDASVATVANGVVTAVGAGTATITATATNGTADTSDDQTATCTVTVSYVNVSGVTLSQTAASMTVGDAALTLTATVAPSNASNKTVTWTTSDASVATVANGVVTAVAAGTATITATATNGTADTSDDFSATCTVTVTDPATKYDLTLADGSDDHGTVAFTVGGAAATQAKKDDVVTVRVTPNEGYSAKDVTVKAYTSFNAAGARAATPSLQDEVTVTKQEDGTWQFTMPAANVWVEVTYTKNLQDAWIQTIANQTYTGSAIEPTIEVKDGETTLVLNTDYTVAYSNNTNAGEATVTITAVAGSDYSGTATKTFTIVKAASAVTQAPEGKSLPYTGEAQALVEAGTAQGGVLQYSTDGTNFSAEVPTATEDGTYTIYYKVVGDANHNDTEAQTVSTTITATRVSVAAKSYATYITDKAVSLLAADKTAGVELSTVTAADQSAGTVTLAALTSVDANTPMLIYNPTDAERDVVLIPATGTMEAQPADIFQGTLEEKTFTDEDMQAADYYVLQSNNFVWVKDAGTIAAGKCWIAIGKSQPAASARRLSIRLRDGEATGIKEIGQTGSLQSDDWYDLNGRRVEKPARGLYIKNGRKVVVK